MWLVSLLSSSVVKILLGNNRVLDKQYCLWYRQRDDRRSSKDLMSDLTGRGQRLFLREMACIMKDDLVCGGNTHLAPVVVSINILCSSSQ